MMSSCRMNITSRGGSELKYLVEMFTPEYPATSSPKEFIQDGEVA